MKVVDDVRGVDIKRAMEAKVPSFMLFLIPAGIIGYYMYKKWREK